MKYLLLIPLLVSCSVLQKPDVASSNKLGAMTLHLGFRDLGSDFGDVDKQPVIGLEIKVQPTERVSPWAIEWGLMFSTDDDTFFDPILGGNVDVDADVFEGYVGGRYTFPLENPKIHPYLGAGLSVINVDFDLDGGPLGSVSDDDTSLAGYIHGGVLFDLSERWFTGVDVRALLGSDLDIFGSSGDADYVQGSAVFGFRW